MARLYTLIYLSPVKNIFALSLSERGFLSSIDALKFPRAAIYYAENHCKWTDFVKKVKLATAAAKLLQPTLTSGARTSELYSMEKNGFIPDEIARPRKAGLDAA